MKTRIISAVIGIPLILLAFFLNGYFPLCINIICALASLVCAVELLNAKSLIKDYSISVPCMLFSALMPMLVVTELWQWLIYLFVFYLVSLLIIKNQKYSFNDVAYLITAIGLSTAGFATLAATRLIEATPGYCFLIVLCIATAWLADAGAYFVGSACGKHKLCPNVSPKKTVEGAIGGVIIGTLGAIAVAWVYDSFIFPATWTHGFGHCGVFVDFKGVIVIGVLATITSMVGDLTFSLIKRSCNVKDYGNIIPGHGGILDRCDSIIMTAPLLFLFAQNWPLTMVCN